MDLRSGRILAVPALQKVDSDPDEPAAKRPRKETKDVDSLDATLARTPEDVESEQNEEERTEEVKEKDEEENGKTEDVPYFNNPEEPVAKRPRKETKDVDSLDATLARTPEDVESEQNEKERTEEVKEKDEDDNGKTEDIPYFNTESEEKQEERSEEINRTNNEETDQTEEVQYVVDIDEDTSDDEEDRRQADNFANKNRTFTLFQIQTLKEKAERFFERDAPFQKAPWFYRDKPKEFFTEAEQNNGIMAAYEKDCSGDPKSTINGKINGLFFGTYQLPYRSYFGDTRIKVPATFFLSGHAKKDNISQKLRIYFADFYCMDRRCNRHWVTLVVTYKGSDADQFCRSKLPRIKLSDNKFLKVEDGSVFLRNTDLDRIEIFYADDIDLNHWKANKAVIESVCTSGRGRSTGGKPKQARCTICNL